MFTILKKFLYGFGNQVRDLIYVNDNAQAILKIGTSKHLNQSFNIPGNKTISESKFSKKFVEYLIKQ